MSPLRENAEVVENQKQGLLEFALILVIAVPEKDFQQKRIRQSNLLPSCKTSTSPGDVSRSACGSTALQRTQVLLAVNVQMLHLRQEV